MEKQWTSNAEWPDTIPVQSDGTRITTDSHDTKEQAEGVCRLLKKEGWSFRGVFPIRTWVEEKK